MSALKIIFQTLFLLAVLSLSAQALEENPAPGEPRLGFCYAGGGTFFHHITAKLANNRYEMHSEVAVLGTGVLKTKRHLLPGLAVISMKYTGKRVMALANGFSLQVRQWEECTPIQEKVVLVPGWNTPSLGAAWSGALQ